MTESKKNGRVITLFSPKGGVGKTLISLNTAVGFSLKNKKTLLLDLDLKAPQHTAKLLRIKCKYSLFDFLAYTEDLKAGRKSLEKHLAYHEESGLYFLPAILHAQEKVSLDSERIKEFIPFLISRFDYIIADGGSIITDQLVDLFDFSTLIFLLLTPELTSIYQMEWVINTLHNLGFPSKMMKLVVNRAESKGGVSFQELKLLFPIEVIASLPSEGKLVGLSINIDKRRPLVIDAPKAEISKAIGDTVDKIISREGKLGVGKKELTGTRGGKGKKQHKTGSENFLGKVGKLREPQEIEGEEDAVRQLKQKVHERLLSEMNLRRVPVEQMMSDDKAARELKEKAERLIADIVTDEAGGVISSSEVRNKIIQEILNEALGLGPLEDLLNDSTVTEIMVNNKDQVYIERYGKLEQASNTFSSNEQVRIIIERILAPLGRRIDESSPYVDARLRDGSRVNVIISPLSLTGPTLTIRKFSKRRLTINDLIEDFGSLTKEMALFLNNCVKARKNILVSGGTGSGKTTFLNILSEVIPDGERIITIEDSAELKLHHDHWIRLESRPPNIEGIGEIAVKDLFRNSLRMRPDRIIVGEVRGQEVLDMLQAMNTGHDGSLSTVHANSPRDVIIRLDSMILMAGVELPIRAIREIIASALDMIVHTARLADGTRKVTAITEVGEMVDESNIGLYDIFRFEQTGVTAEGKVVGEFNSCGYKPSFYDNMVAQGLGLPDDIFTPKEKKDKSK